jgi:hypothetical protein
LLTSIDSCLFLSIPAYSCGFLLILSEIPAYSCRFLSIPVDSCLFLSISVDSCPFLWILSEIPVDSGPFLQIPTGISRGMKSTGRGHWITSSNYRTCHQSWLSGTSLLLGMFGGGFRWGKNVFIVYNNYKNLSCPFSCCWGAG